MLWKAYGPQVDLWALGVVLFQLLVGRLPFHASSNQELFRQIEKSPEHLKRLFASALLTIEPPTRPSYPPPSLPPAASLTAQHSLRTARLAHPPP